MEIKAGQLNLVDGKLVPDNRKGLLRISQLEQQLVMMEWFEREGEATKAEPSDTLVLTLAIDECNWKQIGNPKSRCLVFQMQGKDSRFFWLQEANPENDDVVLSQLKAAVAPDAAPSDPPAPAAAPIASSIPAAAAPSSSGAVDAGALASILGNIMGGNPGVDPNAMADMQQYMRGMAKAPGPTLGEVLSPEVMLPLLQGKDTLDQLKEFLPEPHQSYQGLMGVIQSPQFSQQLESFSHALQTGQLDLLQFGLQAKGFTVADFLESIQESVRKDDQANDQMQQ